MKILLDIKESKALFFMELLNNFSFVKAQPVTKELLLQEIKEKAGVITETNEKVGEKPLFADTFGIWADRDIDMKMIRKEIRNKRTKYYNNATL